MAEREHIPGQGCWRDLIDPFERNRYIRAMGVNPRGADLKRFLDQGPEGEVVMINLLRFAKGGREQYEAYAYAIEPFLLRVGGEITYAGIAGDALVAEDGQAWDAIVIVKYPSRAAFSQMVADPGYQAITHLRTSALRETVLQPTTPWLRSAS